MYSMVGWGMCCLWFLHRSLFRCFLPFSEKCCSLLVPFLSVFFLCYVPSDYYQILFGYKLNKASLYWTCFHLPSACILPFRLRQFGIRHLLRNCSLYWACSFNLHRMHIGYLLYNASLYWTCYISPTFGLCFALLLLTIWELSPSANLFSVLSLFLPPAFSFCIACKFPTFWVHRLILNFVHVMFLCLQSVWKVSFSFCGFWALADFWLCIWWEACMYVPQILEFHLRWYGGHHLLQEYSLYWACSPHLPPASGGTC